MKSFNQQVNKPIYNEKSKSKEWGRGGGGEQTMKSIARGAFPNRRTGGDICRQGKIGGGRARQGKEKTKGTSNRLGTEERRTADPGLSKTGEVRKRHARDFPADKPLRSRGKEDGDRESLGAYRKTKKEDSGSHDEWVIQKGRFRDPFEGQGVMRAQGVSQGSRKCSLRTAVMRA